MKYLKILFVVVKYTECNACSYLICNLIFFYCSESVYLLSWRFMLKSTHSRCNKSGTTFFAAGEFYYMDWICGWSSKREVTRKALKIYEVSRREHLEKCQCGRKFSDQWRLK